MSDIVVTPVPSQESAPKVSSIELSPVVQEQPAVVEQAPKESKPEPKLGPKFAELAKRERAQFQREESLKAQAAQLQPLQEAIAQARKNPLKLLEAAGLTYEEISEFILSDGESVLEDTSVEKKLSDLQAKIEAKEAAESKAKADSQQATVNQQIDAFKQSISSEVASNPAYELIHSLGQEDMVYDVVLSHFNETGNVLPLPEALQAIESYLTEQSQKILKAKKFAGHGTQAIAQPELKARSPFTLSSKTDSPTATPSSEHLTPQQARDRALSMLRFK